mgnify:CR=1 FL=1
MKQLAQGIAALGRGRDKMLVHMTPNYFFTVAKMDGFIEAVKQLLGELKQSGVQAIYLNKVDPSIVQALQSAGAAPQQSDKPEYKLMAAI